MYFSRFPFASTSTHFSKTLVTLEFVEMIETNVTVCPRVEAAAKQRKCWAHTNADALTGGEQVPPNHKVMTVTSGLKALKGKIITRLFF